MQNLKKICQTALYILAATTISMHQAYADADTFHELYDQLTFDRDERRAAPVSRPSRSTSPEDVTRDVFLSQAMVSRMQGAIRKLRKTVSSGGWPTISPTGKRISVNSSGREVARVKRQLIIRGDLSAYSVGSRDQFDDNMKDALIRFQKRHGLQQNGQVDRKTRRMLSVSAVRRLRQMQTNLLRLRNVIARNKGSRYVVVNIPDFSMQAVSDGRVDLTSRVVVGRYDRQTPSLSVEILGVNFNPYWHVPQSLVDADLIPLQIKRRDYLQAQKIRAFESWGGREVPLNQINWNSVDASRLKYRQEPGPFNALGLARIHMPNPDIIYLHDTPLKRLFNQRHRAYSAGCIRVERIQDLVRWILQDNTEWSESRISNAFDSRERLDAMNKKPIPVHLMYLTSWVSEDGEIQYRNDIYKRDGRGGLDGQLIAQNRNLRPLSP